MTASELIQASLRKGGVYASGETPTGNELSDGLSALQFMLRSWATLKIYAFSSVWETKTLTAGTASYTWGSGGSITTTRPHQVIDAYIRDDQNIDHPVEILAERDYRRIAVKSTSARPYALTLHPTYPLAEIYLYPTPDAAEVLHLESFKPFTETSSFDAVGSTLAFPPQYEEALIYNLWVRLSSEYGKPVTAEVRDIASSSLNKLITLNAGNSVEPVRIALPVGSARSGYSINSDSYR